MSGGEAYVGGLVSLTILKELAPVFTAMVISARAGTAMASELGIVANIIADVICAIASDIPSKLDDNGFFLCSGIINTKRDRVEKALADAGFVIEECMEKHDWLAYICKKA